MVILQENLEPLLAYASVKYLMNEIIFDKIFH